MQNATYNTDIIEIDDEQAQSAKVLASLLSNPQSRKRGLIDLLGINCAINYLNSKRIRIDTRRSVYKIPLLFEEYKLSDIYFKNYRIDVITLYKEKTVKIPKTHIDMDIMPHFYFIVQIGSKIQEAKMIGFIDAKNIPACSHDSKFYYPTLDLIFSVDKFIYYTRHSIPNKTLLGRHVDCMGLFLKFLDNDLSLVYKRQMIQHLMNCDSCRANFIDTVEFENLANSIRFYPELIKKSEKRTKVENAMSSNPQNGRFQNFQDRLEEADISLKQEEDPNFINIEQGVPAIESSRTVEMFDIGNDPKKISKNVIDLIFKNTPKFEIQQIKTVISKKNIRSIIIISAIFILMGVFAIISINGSPKPIEDNIDEASDFDYAFDEFADDFSYKAQEVQPVSRRKSIEDLLPAKNKMPIAYSPSVAKVAWEAPESVIKKDEYTKFLQLTGKNIKLNLQNDLLLIDDIPLSKNAKVDIKISSSGDVSSVKLTQSSGSESIDLSIKKVIKDTLAYMKPPALGLMAKPVVITLNVFFN